EGYRTALQAAGIRLNPAYELATPVSPEAGAMALETLLALPEPPTAVFMASDTQAIGALDAARRRGRRVPEDLTIVGYNDIEMAQYFGLSTMRIPMREMGRRGVDLLLKCMHGENDSAPRCRLPADFIDRGTCGPPRSRRDELTL